MNIAHLLTFLRIILIPLFPVFYLYYVPFNLNIKVLPYILLSILAVCEFTDLIDGVVARKKNKVTNFGKIIDPLADTIAHTSIFFTFTQGLISVPLLIVFILLYRELIIGGLRTLCALRGIALSARNSGKIKTLILATISFIVILMIIPYSYDMISIDFLQSSSLILIIIGCIASVYSAIDYFLYNHKLLRNIFE